MILYSSANCFCPIRKSKYNSRNDNADVQLSAGENGKKIPAHKAVLSFVSKYFQLRESIESTVVIPDIDSDNLEAVLKFIYCGTVEIPSSLAAFEIFKSAHLMELPQLMRFAEDYLLRYMTEDVSLEVYFQAKLFHNNRLFNKAKEVIAKEFKSISQTEYFKHLDKDSLVELIGEAKKVVYADDIAKAVLFWIDFDKSKLAYLKEFLQILDIENIKSYTIVDELFQYCTEKEECEIIIKALEKRNCPRTVVKSNNWNSQSQKLIVICEINRNSICDF